MIQFEERVMTVVDHRNGGAFGDTSMNSYVNHSDQQIDQSISPKQVERSTLPPVVICPTEVDTISITLEKNQQCACKDCGKLFNSVWYLKQHAVKHSNDRPFRCKFCFKTYKFRSNLYQHKCPDRIKLGRRSLSRPLLPNQQMLGSPEAIGRGGNMKSLISFDLSSVCPFQSPMYGPNIIVFPMPSESTESNGHSETTSTEVNGTDGKTEEKHDERPKRKPLAPAVIDYYLQRNKQKLHQCRKCRSQFPTYEYWLRHAEYHKEIETLQYKCQQCPQRFTSEKNLRKHSEIHVSNAQFACNQCCSCFTSMLAVRRHRDRCQPCRTRTFARSTDDMQIEAATSSTDDYAFIDEAEASEQYQLSILDDELTCGKGTDSGLGSEGSSHSFTTSPTRSSTHLEDDEGFDADRKRHSVSSEKSNTDSVTIKKEKNDEENPLTRSRLGQIPYSICPDIKTIPSVSTSDSALRKPSSSTFSEASTSSFIGYGSPFSSDYHFQTADSILHMEKVGGLSSSTFSIGSVAMNVPTVRQSEVTMLWKPIIVQQNRLKSHLTSLGRTYCDVSSVFAGEYALHFVASFFVNRVIRTLATVVVSILNGLICLYIQNSTIKNGELLEYFGIHF
ncbi:hypothetical protein AB6A40_004038 [Gnathostoma spinigerum]|uniref:C2H2-type domain-containing protein n=1 Tax=Gnathostoma spinigerum TaxID=75299 RepID=A0ABD6EJ06_9BILA